MVSALMRLYDHPHPYQPGRTIRGYDRAHAIRTARMCAAVATRLGHPADRVMQYQIACLLHDLGRAGLDRPLFGKIWSWAKQHGIPTRPREWRAVYPDTTYGRETEAFLHRYAAGLHKIGVPIDRWTREQIDMRLGYARRLKRRLRLARPALRELGIRWFSWMESVMLYYYYPEKLQGAVPWVHQLAEILVACEQFEAYSNRRRGADYYTRSRETVEDAFNYLKKLQLECIVGEPVVRALTMLVAEGAFDPILREARGIPLSLRERRHLQGIMKAPECR